MFFFVKTNFNPSFQELVRQKWDRGLFFIHLDTREVHIAGITQHPDEAWMCQVARNLAMTS